MVEAVSSPTRQTRSENTTVPAGHKVLKEGKANILYIEEKMEKDEQNRVTNAAGGKR